MKLKEYRIIVDRADLCTLFAALRYYQQRGLGDPANRPLDIHELATDGEDGVISLNDTGIDALCDKLQDAEEVRS